MHIPSSRAAQRATAQEQRQRRVLTELNEQDKAQRANMQRLRLMRLEKEAVKPAIPRKGRSGVR